ncbi:thyrotropin-releasing hormone receptor [Aphidius gifuensis]|uniref:thyrotropin-releasing hormone receptor n=1 Tax=Aphidius gifuensis TaxID=684658 RepID=UPI001CDC02CA|nr:thyrotropin-releasing hormone receptor [Aphidius gifuensis]
MSEDNANKTAQSDLIETIIFTVQFYYTPVLVLFGSFGNCLSVYIFFSTKMRRVSSSWYLSALAISDTFFLLSIFITWLNIIGVGIFNLPGYCQFFVYLSTLCSFLSVWFVVTFTIERFVAVRYPLKRQSMCTVTRAKILLIILSLFGLIICCPVLWFSSPIKMDIKTNTTICILVKEWEKWANIFNVVDTIITFVIPFSIIVILNGLIIKTIWKLSNIRKTLIKTKNIHKTIQCNEQFRNNQTNNIKKRKNKLYNYGVSQKKVTKMLLIVSSVFLCFNLPAYVLRVRAFLEADKEPPRSIIIIQHICNLLFDTNFGINFFLYCASGQNFRSAVLRIILRRPHRLDSARPISNNDFRRSSSMGRQRTVVYDVPWSDIGEELKTLSIKNNSKKKNLINKTSQNL